MLKIAWAPNYHHVLPKEHRFPMEKYTLLPEQLLYEGTVNAINFFEPKQANEFEILKTHSEFYWFNLKNLLLDDKTMRKTGFPLSKSLVDREITIMQGTIDASVFALQYGCAMNIAGGTHHAFYNRGEGFCLLNDIAMAANYLLNNNLVKQILVVDLDVHQGNGTAALFKNNTKVFTFSMHGDKNYPLLKENSDLDIALPDFINDTSYLKILDYNLAKLFEKVKPDFVFYQCGVDVLQTDKLGRMAMTIDGCKQRDKIVLQMCKNNDVPVACSMGGGYSHKISDIVNAHANTYRLAQEIFF